MKEELQFVLIKKTEEEILDFFQEKEDKTGYVRELVLEDIENGRNGTDQI